MPTCHHIPLDKDERGKFRFLLRQDYDGLARLRPTALKPTLSAPDFEMYF